MPVNQYGNVDLKNMSEAELEIVVQVIQKDFELKAAEKARLRRHRRQLKDYDKRVSILASSNFNERFCVICFKQFFFLIAPKRICYSCRHSMCNGCSVWIPAIKAFICMLCQKERNLKSMGCDWYYGLLKNRFQQDGSEIVAQSLYNSQGQYSFVHIFYRKICYHFKPEWLKNLQQSEMEDSIVTPDLLRKVKGAQISRYRQKIHSKWEEMQQRLVQLDRSDINRAKKDEAWHYLIEEYKNDFRDILKEFSQHLYITLENYASKIDDPNLNINEQVITTVYDEVELMIGYKINYMPEEMGSILSDVESTTSLFVGSQMEEKLAGALVNKVIQDHSLNELETYDIKCLDNFNDHLQADDESSTASYLYPSQQFNGTIANGLASEQSSTVASSFLDNETSIEISKSHTLQYSTFPQAYKTTDSPSTIDDVSELCDVVLSAKELQSILRYSNSDRRSFRQFIERTIKIPYGEPIKFQIRLNGISDQEVTWTKTHHNETEVLYESEHTEIMKISSNKMTSFYFKKWQTTGSDAGIYTALIFGKPIVEFTVNILVNNKKCVKPSFRLKMLNCNCRSGQVGEFSIEALGYPEPRIRFYYKNLLISPTGDKYKIEFKDQISRYNLKIFNVTDSDHGSYKCVATNSSGTSECSAQLQVTNVKFRFDHKIPRSSSNSSVEEDALRYLTSRNLDSMDSTNEPLNESSMEPIRSPKSNKNPISMKNHQSLNTAPGTSKGNIDRNFSLDDSKNQNSSRKYPFLQASMSQDNSKQYQSPSSMKALGSSSRTPPPDTVVGREIPDEIRMIEMRGSNTLPRPTHSFSTENIDSTYNLSKSSREEALNTSRYSLSNSNSNISRLKQLFEQPEFPKVQRNSSITGRTPHPDSNRSQSPFTKEVRVNSKDYSN